MAGVDSVFNSDVVDVQKQIMNIYFNMLNYRLQLYPDYRQIPAAAGNIRTNIRIKWFICPLVCSVASPGRHTHLLAHTEEGVVDGVTGSAVKHDSNTFFTLNITTVNSGTPRLTKKTAVKSLLLILFIYFMYFFADLNHFDVLFYYLNGPGFVAVVTDIITVLSVLP